MILELELDQAHLRFLSRFGLIHHLQIHPLRSQRELRFMVIPKVLLQLKEHEPYPIHQC